MFLQVTVDLFGNILRQGHCWEPVKRSLPCASDGSAGQNKTKRAIETDVNAAHDSFDFFRQQVRDGDVYAVRRRAVDNPGWAAESPVNCGGFNRAPSSFRCSSPALFLGWSDYEKLMTGRLEGEDQFVQEK